MFLSLFNELIPEKIPTSIKTHRRRFGVIPAEPCRSSSMQTLAESPCAEKAVTDNPTQLPY